MSHPNTFIRNLSSADAALLNKAVTMRSLSLNEVIAEPGDQMGHALFMHSGLLSIVVPLESGESVEAAIVGRDGVFGATAAFGARYHVSKAVVQTAGSASSVKSADLTQMASQSETLRQALVAHEQFTLAQAQQSAACNARHTIPQRLASWLLRASDRSEQQELHLTQEYLAQMMGVQRASVSLAAATFRKDGLISYRRGRIIIEKPLALEKVACECCGAIRLQHERTVGVKETTKPPAQ